MIKLHNRCHLTITCGDQVPPTPRLSCSETLDSEPAPARAFFQHHSAANTTKHPLDDCLSPPATKRINKWCGTRCCATTDVRSNVLASWQRPARSSTTCLAAKVWANKRRLGSRSVDNRTCSRGRTVVYIRFDQVRRRPWGSWRATLSSPNPPTKGPSMHDQAGREGRTPQDIIICIWRWPPLSAVHWQF